MVYGFVVVNLWFTIIKLLIYSDNLLIIFSWCLTHFLTYLRIVFFFIKFVYLDLDLDCPDRCLYLSWHYFPCISCLLADLAWNSPCYSVICSASSINGWQCWIDCYLFIKHFLICLLVKYLSVNCSSSSTEIICLFSKSKLTNLYF